MYVTAKLVFKIIRTARVYSTNALFTCFFECQFRIMTAFHYTRKKVNWCIEAVLLF